MGLLEDVRGAAGDGPDGESSAEERREALQMLQDTVAVMRRVLGPQHPETKRVQHNLEAYREAFPTTA